MPSGDQSGWISKINLAMAGVEAGILGGLFMMLWLAFLSLLQGRFDRFSLSSAGAEPHSKPYAVGV